MADWQPILVKKEFPHSASLDLSKMLVHEHLCPDLKCGDICVLLRSAPNNSGVCKALSKDVLNKVAVEHIFTLAVILKDLSKLACTEVLVYSIQGYHLQH